MRSDSNLKNIIDARLAELTVSHDLEDRIRCASLHKKRYLQKPWTVVIIVCICIMISIPAMASKIPVFQDLVQMIDPALARFLQPIELVSEDKGIQMEVVAAMSDGETAIVYITLQDLTGDRVDRTVDLYNYSIDDANIFSHELVDYNEKTKKATIRMIANGGHQLNGKKVTIRISSFLSGKDDYGQIATDIKLTDVVHETPKTMKLDMSNIPGGGGELYSEFEKRGTVDILKVDEKTVALPPIDFAQISNIGFVQGRLHIQLKWKESIDDHGSLYLLNANGDRIDPSNLYFGVDEQGNIGYGRQYIEYIFDVNPSQISNYSLHGSFIRNKKYTEGKWAVTFQIEAEDPSKKIARNIDLGHLKLDHIIIQPTGIRMNGNMTTPDQVVVEMTMKDGKKVSYNHAVAQGAKGSLSVKYFPTSPVDLQNMKEVRVNGELITFE
ncbi:DUF4179 domain-containing protein [Paenibacillus guangzhouensis]|uniref:DUF4179 domain-containing protein n=1 Tax=Paenibacillus guangzhouensis TaxID=1473112 RepID=UPI001267022F|nr:DUF4179 domain-containing protein [Paenibacillus guangzhouensis]